MRAANPSSRSAIAQRGFTLIELMVGLLLGLLTVLVISQVLATSEGKRRSVSMGSDAQVNGAMSLYTLQRDIQMAGYGLTSSMDALGCTVKAQYDTSAEFSFTLAPVVINDGAGDAPDTITVLRSRTADFSVPMILTEDHPQAASHFTVESSFGAVAGNMMIAVPKLQDLGHWCTLFNATNDTASATAKLGPTRVPHVTGTGGEWNQSGIFPASGYLKDDYLLNMNSLVLRSYSINTVNNANNLQVTERSSTDGKMAPSQDLYSKVVNLQALYGKGKLDASGNMVVDSYDTSTPGTSDEWQKVIAIRIAVVTRSSQYEKNPVTQAPPQWDVGTTATITGQTTTTCNGASKCVALKVDEIPDWDHYRYKVFDTIVPLRNVLWNSH